jgi:hypothetical protein
MVNSTRSIDNGDGQKQSDLKVHQYFERGYYRSREHLPPRRGEIVRGNERLLAQFFIDVKDDCIQHASYKCSTCVVLVAYCELLAEMIIGLSRKEVVKVTPSNLVLAFPRCRVKDMTELLWPYRRCTPLCTMQHTIYRTIIGSVAPDVKCSGDFSK